jgi:AhpD family alkylhydroperoxidase
MNTFTLYTPASAPSGSGDILKGIEKAWGFIPNLHRELAESPQALEAYGMLWSLVEKTGFTPVERHVAYLAVIYENGCEYCMAGHTKLSLGAGLTPDQVEAIRGNRPLEDTKLESVRVFAAEVTRRRGRLSDAQVSAFLNAGYGNRAILDVLLIAATKLISNYTNHFAHTPLDAFMKGSEWSAP